MYNSLISVIIVNYNSGDYLLKCINSLQQSELPLEIFVVDNASKDRSLDLLRQTHSHLPQLHIIENQTNLGFSKANNIAIRKAKGEFILLLNPDCIMTPSALKKMQSTVDQYPDVGMAGCLIRNMDGTIQPTCLRKFPTPWNSFVRAFNLNKLISKWRGLDLADQLRVTAPIQVEAISGAFMYIRRAALERVGLLDESYFLYGEDLDWMIRFHQAGWQILFVPEVEIYHAKGVCGTKRPHWVLWQKHKAMTQFYNKFFRKKYPLLFMWLVYVGIWSRFAWLSLWQMMRGRIGVKE